MSNLNIDQKHATDVDRVLRKKIEDFTGMCISSKVNTTKLNQRRLYARFYAFWRLEESSLKEMNSKDIIKNNIVHHHKSEILSKIMEIFNKINVKLVLSRAKKIVEAHNKLIKRGFDYSLTKKRIELIYKIANDLYKKLKENSVTEGLGSSAPVPQPARVVPVRTEGQTSPPSRKGEIMPPPSTWIWNQTTLRENWTKINYILDENDDTIATVKDKSRIIRESATFRYMKFMCENFPPGFGDEMKKSFKENTEFDPPRVFFELSDPDTS